MKFHLFSLVALLGFLLTIAAPVSAQTTATATSTEKKHSIGTPKIVAINGNSITAGKKQTVYLVDANTVIIDGAGNPTSLSTATVGEKISGSYIENADGTKVLSKLRLGAKTETGTSTSTAASAPEPVAAPAPTPTATTSTDTTAATTTTTKVKKLHFTGKVVSVDAADNSIVIHGTADKTYTLDPGAKVTDSTGAASSLSSATVGGKVSGTYAKNADGSLTIYTLKLSK